MILLNFSHPISAAQQQQIESLVGEPLTQVLDIPVQFDNAQPFVPQLETLLAAVPLAPDTLQTEPLLVNLPSYNYISAMLLAALHGIMGYFPSIVRIRPAAEGAATRFVAAEIINLQALRENQRQKRHNTDPE